MLSVLEHAFLPEAPVVRAAHKTSRAFDGDALAWITVAVGCGEGAGLRGVPTTPRTRSKTTAERCIVEI